jgi:hypothetical protein
MNKTEIKQARKVVHEKAGKIATIGIKLLFARYSPFCSLDKYNSILHAYIKEINPREGNFVGTTEELIQILDMMKWKHKHFATARAETVYVLGRFPELKLHDNLIYDYIRSKR